MFLKTLYKPALLCLLILTGCPAFAQYSMYDRNSQARADYHNLLMYRKAKADGSNLKKWWKSESTIGTAFSGSMTFTERSKYDSVEYSSQRSFDSVIKGTGKALLGIHVNGNTSSLLARLSGSSMLSFSWGIQADVMRWKINSFDGNTLKISEQSLIVGNIGIPLAVEYKWGCDVDFDPELKTCFAIGGGAMPLASGSFYGASSDHVNFRVAPYLYASFGFYARGCWKLRATFLPGRYTIFEDYQSNNAGVINTMNMQGTNTITIGISTMAYSGDWGTGRAWRGSRSSGGGRRHHVHENMRMF